MTKPASSRRRTICGTESVRNVSAKRWTLRSRPRRSTYSWSKMVSWRRAVLAHRLDQRHRRLCVFAARQAGAAPVLAPARKVGHQIEPEEAAAFEHARHRGERGREIVLARQRLQDAVRRHHQPEAFARPERQVTDVAADEERTLGEPRARQARPRARQHWCREIDPNERHPRLDDRERDPSRAAAQFEDGSVVGDRQPLPEADVAPRDGPGILPVVEGRVPGPSLPSRAVPSSMPAGPHPRSTCETPAVTPPAAPQSQRASCSGSRQRPIQRCWRPWRTGRWP